MNRAALFLSFLLYGLLSHQCLLGQTGFHQFRVKNIFGDSIDLSDFAGKKLLVVNTASFCGYTYQFTKLRQLDSAYQSYGFRVIGFPSNDFGGQDPYADSTINSFCQNQYAIQFPMMAKISIITGDTSPVYKWLQRKALNGVANAPVDWNFNKFLIDENGNWLRHYYSATQPNDTAITRWIIQGITPVSIKMKDDWRVFTDDLKQLHILHPAGMMPARLQFYTLQGRLLWEQNLVQSEEECIVRLLGGKVETGLLFITGLSGEILHRRVVSLP